MHCICIKNQSIPHKIIIITTLVSEAINYASSDTWVHALSSLEDTTQHKIAYFGDHLNCSIYYANIYRNHVLNFVIV